MTSEILFLRNEVTPAMIRGVWMSIRLIVPSAIFGLIIGIVVGTLRVYGHSFLKAAANIYVTFFRGFPLLVQLYLWYFGLARFGIFFTPYTAAVIGFSLCSGAYHSEYVRGALLSIKSGQMLGAQSLGFSKTQALFSIILPQAVRRALPGCGNELIYLIKYSSLAYMVTCIELTGEAKILASLYFKYMEMFFIAGVIYLVMVSVGTWLLSTVENHLIIPGFEPPRA